MKTKTIRRAIELRLFALVLLATCAFAAAANAQSFSARFTLPFETHWGKNVLPAGNYTMSLNSQTNVALIRSADGKTVGFTPIRTRACAGPNQRSLCDAIDVYTACIGAVRFDLDDNPAGVYYIIIGVCFEPVCIGLVKIAGIENGTGTYRGKNIDIKLPLLASFGKYLYDAVGTLGSIDGRGGCSFHHFNPFYIV